MLVLSRRIQESVVVGGSRDCERLATVTVLEICGSRVKLGFDVRKDVPVHRWEVWERIRVDGQPDTPPQSPVAPVA
jgi:carbon storage regulator CsrA